MMKRFFHTVVLFMVGIWFGALTGCTRTDTVPDALRGGEMSFTASASTKAAATTTETVSTMGVSAYLTGTDSWASVAATATPDWIYNRKVSKNGSEWTYSPVAYWPYDTARKLSFFAYSPYATASNGISLSAGSAAGNPTVTLTVAETPADQIDLLVATPLLDKTNTYGTVGFAFGHATTTIDFTAKAVAVSVDYSLQLSGITMNFAAANGRILRRGTVDLATGIWTLAASDTDPSFTAPITIGMPAIAPTLTTEVQTVTADDAKLFMLPQPISTGAVTLDVVFTKTYAADAQTEEVRFDDVVLPATVWEKGECYAYLLTVDLVNNSMTATITPWNTAEIDQSDQNYLSVGKSTVTVPNTKAGDYAVDISTNYTGKITAKAVDLATGTKAAWLTDLRVATTNNSVTFDIAAQSATGRERRATVTLTAGKLSTSFTVVQSANGKYVLEVSATPVSYMGGTIGYSVLSRFEPYNGAAVAETWIAEMVDADGNIVAAPDWLSMTANGDGQLTAAAFTATATPQTSVNVSAGSIMSTVSAGVVYGTPTDRYDLSTKGGTSIRETANCYIVNGAGYYRFPCNVMGNGDRGIIAGGNFTNYLGRTITSAAIDMTSGDWRAELLWQDTPDVIKNVTLDGNNISFDTAVAADLHQCNAVIALQVSTDGGATYTTAWSWHIWVTFWHNDSFNDTLTSSTGLRFDVMPVALGYKVTETGTIVYYPSRTALVRFSQTNGMTQTVAFSQASHLEIPTVGTNVLYQWGRKDPMPCGTLATLSPAAAEATIAAGIRDPEIFIMPQASGDWLSTPNAHLWGNPDEHVLDDWISKTIYDPSPRSYCMSLKTNYDRFSLSTVAGRWSHGHSFYCAGTSGETVYFNAHGYRDGADETEENDSGYYWTMNVNADGTSSALQFDAVSIDCDASVDRGRACSVRPMIETVYLDIEDKNRHDYDDTIWN